MKMFPSCAFAAILSCAGCGGADGAGGGTKDLSRFLGATWNTTITTTIACSGQAPATASSPTTLSFSPGSGADLQYLSSSGCMFKFNVSGDTASLSNGPVSCSTTSGGASYVLTISSYTASTSDGHNLTVNASGSVASGGFSCPTTLTGSATR